jgi:hypothetical protein
MGQMEMKQIFNIEKKNSIWTKVTQVSEVGHWPLVWFTRKGFLRHRIYLISIKYLEKNLQKKTR